MTSLSSFLGGNKYLNIREFVANTTFTVPAGVTRMRIAAMGAGGAGAIYYADPNDNKVVGGGGGGGYTEGIYNVTPGNNLSITVGKGGTASIPALGVGTNGGSGGTTSVSGMDSGTCSATGGAGGTYSNNSIGVSAAAGGTGSGGSISTFSGGAGGSVQANTSISRASTGGGAPGCEFGQGGRGGNVTNGAGATGGGGLVNGNGGDVDISGGTGGGSAGITFSQTSIGAAEAAFAQYPDLSFLPIVPNSVSQFSSFSNVLNTLISGAIWYTDTVVNDPVLIQSFKGSSSSISNLAFAGFGGGGGGTISANDGSNSVYEAGEFAASGGMCFYNSSGQGDANDSDRWYLNNRTRTGRGAGSGGIYVTRVTNLSTLPASYTSGGDGWVRIIWETSDPLV